MDAIVYTGPRMVNAEKETTMIAEAEVNQTEPAESKPEFHILTDSAADWYLKQMACYDAEIALLRTQAEAAIKRVQSDKEGLVNLYGAELEAYIGQKIVLDKRGRKSVILPHGTCQFRTVPASLKLADSTAAMEYACRELAEEAVWQPARLSTIGYIEQAEKALKETGELLPGVERVEARESFSIRFGKDKE